MPGPNHMEPRYSPTMESTPPFLEEKNAVYEMNKRNLKPISPLCHFYSPKTFGLRYKMCNG